MEDNENFFVMSSALSAEEWANVPIEVGKKLNLFVTEKVEELLTARAISETNCHNAETSLNELADKLKDTENALSISDNKLEAAIRTIEELENQITTCTSDISRLQTSANKLEAEAAEFRHQRNLAFGERDELAKTLERCSAEVERLQTEISGLTKQLQSAVTAKCEAQADSNEVAHIKLSLDYKEKRLEQERSLLNNQVEVLAQSLQDRTDELLNMRKDNSLRCIQLENKLSEKSQELEVALESIKSLTDINNNLTSKIEDLSDKLKSQRENDDKAHELYRQELEAQTKLAQLYQNVSEQNEKHAEELTKAVSELQVLLREATEKYGDLETKYKELQLSNEEIVIKKNEYIDLLKQELEVSNEIFKSAKDDSLYKEVEEISPSAAAASRLIKPGMSLTQIYTKYVRINEELVQEKQETNRLNMYIQQILDELEDKGPFLRKQREDYESALETITDLTRQTDTLIMENQSLKEEAIQWKKNEGVLTREIARNKQLINDLGRQVCHFLQEKETSRNGSSSTSIDPDVCDSLSSGDIISKRLVTVNDIMDMQSTNQRLMSVCRELTQKQEEAEACNPAEIAVMKMQLEKLKESQSSLLELHENHNKTLSRVAKQRDMYKNLYEQAVKGGREDVAMDLENASMQDREGSSFSAKGDSESHSDDKLQDLENQLEKTKKEIEVLKEENETYRKEKSANEKILLEQMDEMRKEVHELTRKNCKLTSVIESNDERFKIMQSNVDVYKNQISALEKQNKIYSESNIKHEQMGSYLKDEALQSQTKLSKAEVRLANLEKENALIYDRESRLVKELEYLKKESHAKNILESNIELIKATLERNDAESRIRLEERLDECTRECCALRRRLQEEQDRFRELADHLKKQKDLVQHQMEEEKTESQKLREEIVHLREEILAKQGQMEDLSKKLKDMYTTIPQGSVENVKFREVERMLIDSQAEVQLLNNQLRVMRESVQQHCSVAEGAENQLKLLTEQHERDHQELQSILAEKEARILKLEEQCSEMQGELSIQGDDAGTMDIRTRFYRLDDECKSIKLELDEAKKNLENSQQEVQNLTTNLEITENKYTHEIMLHSNDLQALTTLKEELSASVNQIEELKHAKEQSDGGYEEIKRTLEFQEEFYKNESEKHLQRFKEMDQQNSVLLDQIQTLNNQLTIMQAQSTDQNISIGGGDSSFNRSYTEDEVKSSEQLVRIIKFLRQEKDIAVSKSEIMEAELVRLKSQFELLNKQLEETKARYDAASQESEVSMVTAAKHSEVLRKVETLNAITDSNRTLRTERDTLVEQVNELRARTSILEEQIVPLQESNKEMSLKCDALHSENITLRGEATRWRQRSNALIEKSNRTSPEDWKKLQNERENLAKQLTIERGTSAKLNDEMNAIKQDKNKLEDQLRSLRQQYNQLSETAERTADELAKLKEQVNVISQDLEATKELYSNLIEEKRKVETELESKSDSITDLRNNLLAVRKIAKKYKNQSEELTKEIDALKLQIEEKVKNEATLVDKQDQIKSEVRSEYEERIVQLENSHAEKVTAATEKFRAANEETNTYKKEIEAIKQSSLEKEERFKSLFKNAKDRIVSLTEQNNNLRAELSGNNASDAQNDADRNSELDSLARERDEILLEKQQEKERFISEIESLTQKINQLQRQLGQQSSKPSTSSGVSEKSTTEPPTANIKPMATNPQTQSIQIQPWRTLPETPLASIRPMSMQLRTITVLPTSQGPSAAALVAPQQVHTTGPSNIEQISNSPTSSHTEYMPATSSATPTVVGPRQIAVPPTQSTQDAEDEDNSMQIQPAPQQQAVALVLPRVEQPSNGHAQESGTSSSSNTVTTTQAGLKRPREVDTDGCQTEEPGKAQQLTKRSRVVTAEMLQSHGTVTDSGLEVEYQVPTSSQRDHEEDTDAVIVVESDEDGDGPDEGEGADDDPDDADAEGYDMEVYPEQELNYDDADCQDMEEEEGGNEVEVVEDSSEVPNQSQSNENISKDESSEQAQSEAISSGTDGSSGVTVSQASPSIAVTMPSFSRTRPVAPLSRQQQQSHLLLPHGLEEGGDDGIVPSTPTLFVPRRSDGFGEAVSSPHVPTSGRFTFSESASSNNSVSTEVVPEQTLEFSHADDNSTGRSVPSTPLQASPQESAPIGEGESQHQNVSSEPEIPTITVSVANDEGDLGPNTSLMECMGPPSTAGPSGEMQASDHPEEMLENEDGVTSEGEKPLASEEEEEEGREAEASPSTNTRSRSSLRGSASPSRRSMRSSHMRGGMNRPGPTPIVWNDQQQQQQQLHGSPRHSQQPPHRGGRGQSFAPRVARRSRGRTARGPYRF